MPATLTLENHPFHISFMSHGAIKWGSYIMLVWTLEKGRSPVTDFLAARL